MKGKMKMKKFLSSVVLSAVMTSGAVAQDWSGFYAGVSATSGTSEISGSAVGGLSFSGSSTSPGVYAGYNYALGNNMVLGGELSYGGVDSTTLVMGSAIVDIEEMTQLRARIGYANGKVMPYVTAGWAQADFNVNSGGPVFSGSEDGYTMGLGLEYMISNNMSARVEYGVTKFDNVFSPLVAPEQIDASYDAITVGMAWHF